MPQQSAKIVADIVDLLTPLSSEQRGRIIKASLALLGEATDPIHEPKTPLTATNNTALLANSDEFPLSNKANLWAKQNSITVEQLSHLFHASEGKFEIIATHIPGKGNKEKVLNAYLLVGLSKFLEVGISDFNDASGRSLCQTFGCYNNRHHVEAFKGVNELTGSQSRGWMLTAPGLKAAALLVNELSKSDDR
ncbi:hypothetical protein V1294_001474 [Bradyrhizobium sp. AZCC 1678]